MKTLVILYVIISLIGCSDFIVMERPEKMRQLPSLTEEEKSEIIQNNKKNLQGLWCDINQVFCVQYDHTKFSMYVKEKRKLELLYDREIFISNDSIFSIDTLNESKTFAHTYKMSLTNDSTKIQTLILQFENNRIKDFYRWIK